MSITTTTTRLRPVWYLCAGGRVVPANGKRPPREALWWCQEGDTEWMRVGYDENVTTNPKGE